jgi:hypothetical protein
LVDDGKKVNRWGWAQLDHVFEGYAVRGYHVAKIQQASVDLLGPDRAALTLQLKREASGFFPNFRSARH